MQWSYRPGPDVDPGAVCFFGSAQTAATTIRCTDDGTYMVTLSASDGVQEFPSTDEATVTLSNVPPGYKRIPGFAADKPAAAAEPPPGIVTPAPWQLFRVGDPVTLGTTFSDPGTNDTQTCTIRWDDGSAVQSFDAADGKCARTHTFTHAGMYTITPGITDDDGGVAEALRVMVIVYDPAAGVASGNGWLNSPGDTGFDFTGSYPDAGGDRAGRRGDVRVATRGEPQPPQPSASGLDGRYPERQDRHQGAPPSGSQGRTSASSCTATTAVRPVKAPAASSARTAYAWWCGIRQPTGPFPRASRRSTTTAGARPLTWMRRTRRPLARVSR